MIELTVSRKRKITTAKYENEEIMAAAKQELSDRAPMVESLCAINESLEAFLNQQEKKLRGKHEKIQQG